MDFLEHLLKNYDKNTVDMIIDSFSKERTHSLILNIAKYDESKLDGISLIKKHPFIDYAYYFDNKSHVGNDYRFKNGVFYIQDAAAMMPAYFLDVKPGDVILDMCASPGGKSIDAAIKLNNTGMIIANELSYERAKTLSSNIEKLGFCNVFVSNNDFSKVYMSYQSSFDKIILDAPCSGSFMFRKNELSKLDWNIQKVLSCAEVQKSLINMAAIMLKPGGKIVYSTCSVSPEENENIISEFLKEHDDFHLIKIESNPLFYPSKIDGAIYLMPFIFEGEGQFIALLSKDGTSEKINKNLSESNYRSLVKKDFKLDEFKNCIAKNNLVYAYNSEIKLKNLNILRYGLQISEIKGKVEIPSFQLAHYLNKDKIELDETSFLKYIKGEELSLSTTDGFHIVSYNDINLGYVKVKNCVAKNLYPKGLRH